MAGKFGNLKTKSILLTLVLSGTVLGTAGWKWRAQRQIELDSSRLRSARAAVAAGTPGAALQFFQLSRSLNFPAGREADWLTLQRDALVALDRVGELAGIYGSRPEVILADQTAMRKLYEWFENSDGMNVPATELLDHADMSDPGWTLARARVLMGRGMNAEVVSILAPAHFSGKQEAERIYLLATASPSDRDRAALLEGVKGEELEDPLVRLVRARHFEATNRLREAAWELSEALDKSLDKSPWINEAASFFLRNRNSAMALSIWTRYADTDALSWVRAAAWTRLIGAAPLPAPPADCAPVLASAVKLLQEPCQGFLPAERPADLPPLVDLFWLEWLDRVQTGTPAEALECLARLPEPRNCVNPVLAQLAWRVLQKKTTGRLTAAGCPVSAPVGSFPILAQCEALSLLQPAPGADSAPSLTELAAKQDDPALRDLAALLDSPFALPFVLLVSGWDEAALRLAGDQTPPVAGEAITIRWAQALESRRSPAAALAWLESRTATPTLDLVRADLLLTLNRSAEAAPLVRPHLLTPGQLGIEASTLLARSFLAEKKYNDALRTILENKELSLSVPGHELAARIYIAAGDEEKAAVVLRKIVGVSPAAKEFLAARAWNKGDLETARDLRLELAGLFPDRADYRDLALRVVREISTRQTP